PVRPSVFGPRFTSPEGVFMGCPAPRPASWLLAGGVLLSLLAAPAPAQQPAGGGSDVRLVTKIADTTLQLRVRDMKDGRQPVNQDDLDTLTRYLAYRMTYPQAFDPKDKNFGQPVANVP